MLGQNVIIVPQKAKALFGYDKTIIQLQNTVSTKSAVSPDVTSNMGWKLHGALKEELTIDEALAEIGIKKRAKQIPAGSTTIPSGRVKLNYDPTALSYEGYDLVDEKSFNLFNDRLKKLGIDVDIFDAPNSINTEKAQKFFSAFLDMADTKAASMLDQVSLFEILQENGIEFKYGREIYGEGKALTTYGGSLEERDRIIAVLEDAMGDKFQDATGALDTLKDQHREVNSVVSDKFYGRFTTEYAGVNPDGSINLAKDDASLSDAGDTAGRGRVTGAINDDEVRRLGELVDDHPLMGEMLHGKPGYDSPYATIEDIIEERLGKSGTPVTTTVVNPAPQATTSTATPAGQGAAASTPPPTGSPTTATPAGPAGAASVPPPTGSPTVATPAGPAGAASVPPPSGTSIGTPAHNVSTRTSPRAATQNANAAAQAQAQASATTVTPQARVSSTPTPASPSASAPPASSGAPSRGTNALLKAGKNMSASVASGTKGYGNLKVLGAGVLVGVGAAAYSRNRTQNSRQQIVYDEY
jgi:hypothetical protein